MIVNDKNDLIEGISRRLMQAYANELILLLDGYHEGSRFYHNYRIHLWGELNKLTSCEIPRRLKEPYHG